MRIIKYLSILAMTSMLLISGCVDLSDSNSDTNSNSETENLDVWYFPNTDLYFSINNKGEVNIHNCSLNDGYVIDNFLSATLNNDVLELLYNGKSMATYIVENNGETNNLIVNDELIIPFLIASEVPNTCSNDAIEITYFSPEEATEGVETLFIVNFDYRLTKNSAEIQLGFTSSANGSYRPTSEETLLINESGVGSSSLTVNHIPELFENVPLFFLHINMSPQNIDGPYSPYATDRELITILPSL